MTKHPSVVVHAVLVLVLVVLVAPLFFPVEGGGVDMGAVFFVPALLALGLPWSLGWLVVLGLDASMTVLGVLFGVMVLGGAAANVVLHHRWLERRRTARALGVRP